MSGSAGCRRGSDLTLLWLWCRLAAIAPIGGSLAWEPPYASGVALKKRQKDKKKIIFSKGGLVPYLPTCLPPVSAEAAEEHP